MIKLIKLMISPQNQTIFNQLVLLLVEKLQIILRIDILFMNLINLLQNSTQINSKMIFKSELFLKFSLN